MTKFLIIISITLCLTSCGQTKSDDNNKQVNLKTLSIDNSIIAILPYDKTQHWVFKDYKEATLTKKEIEVIENILTKCINEYNPEQERQFKEINSKHPDYKLDKNNFIIDLKRYKRQYIAATNSKGEKEVWINCFCDTWNKNWKTELIMVNDGGNCYFNLKINLTTEKYYDLMVNGES